MSLNICELGLWHVLRDSKIDDKPRPLGSKTHPGTNVLSSVSLSPGPFILGEYRVSILISVTVSAVDPCIKRLSKMPVLDRLPGN